MPTHQVGKFRAAFLPIEGEAYAWTIFFREHREKALEDTADEGTVLFVTNLHPRHSVRLLVSGNVRTSCTRLTSLYRFQDDDVRSIFSRYGSARRVAFGSLGGSSAVARYAHVFFASSDIVETILKGEREFIAPPIPRESVKSAWPVDMRVCCDTPSMLQHLLSLSARSVVGGAPCCICASQHARGRDE